MKRKTPTQASTRPAALITGGAIRLGRVLALALAEKGYDIALHCNTSKKQAQVTAREVEKKGARCKIYSADLADQTSYKPLVDTVCKDFPRLSVLINNASIFEKGGLMQTTESLFDRHMDINFRAPFFLSQHFARKCKKGHIINITDSYVTKNSATYVPYLLSKKALAEFTRMAARELAPQIQVNAVAPGATKETKNLDKAFLKQRISQLPQGKLTTYEAISDAVLMLLDSAFTGQCIYPDSGDQLI